MIENETPTLPKTLTEAIDARLLDLHVCLPARVETYDSSTQKAAVKPLLKKKYKGITSIELSVIPSVPVQWPSAGGGNAYIHLPLETGDLGIVIVCERSLDYWLSGDGQIVDPLEPRHHDLSDAIFIPGVRPWKAALSNVPEDNLVIQNNTMRIELDPSGKISITGASNEFLTVINGILDHLISAQVNTGIGPMPFTNGTITNLQADKADLETLII